MESESEATYFCQLESESESEHWPGVGAGTVKNSCTRWVAGSDAISNGFHTSDNRYVQVGLQMTVQVWSLIMMKGL